MFDVVGTDQPNMDHGPSESLVSGHSAAVLDPGRRNTAGAQSAKPVQSVPRARPTNVGECMILTEDLLAPDDRVACLAGSRNLVDYDIVDMVADVIFSGEWCISGIHSEHHWVAYKLGISRRHSARLMSVASSPSWP